MRLALLFALALAPGLVFAQNSPQPSPLPATQKPATATLAARTASNAELQSSIDRLTQTNSELLDLLKKQQAVLEDIQFDRRLQSRQIESLEERLQETLFENAKLQGKVDTLTAAAAAPSHAQGAPIGTPAPQPAPVTPPPTPAPPASYLPAATSEGPSGTPSWHRIISLSGTDSRSTDVIQIQGHQWRILWHNQDKEGAAYKNTSALFLNAFPQGDTIPQKVCAKLGSGGGSTDLVGPGSFFIKVEASGGAWAFAVEDFH